MPQRIGLSLFHGGEPYLVDQAAKRAWVEYTGALTSDLDAEVLDPGTDPAEVLAAASATGFFSPFRVVAIHDWRILVPKPGRRPKAGAEDPATRAAEIIGNLPEGSRLLLSVRATVPATHPVRKLAQERGDVQEFPRMRHRDVEEWTSRRVREMRLKLDGRGQRVLLDAVGDDLRLLDTELEKLSVFAAGGGVTPEDVRALVPDSAEHQVWAITDALLAHPGRAILELERALAQGEPAGRLAYMLVRHLRILLAAVASPPGAAGMAGLAAALSTDGRPVSDYTVQKAVEQARGLELGRVEALYRRAGEVEAASRRGTIDEEAALRLLVLGAAVA